MFGRRCAAAAHATVLTAAMIALAVRFSLRDAQPWSAWIYFATPPPVIATLLAAASALSLLIGRRRAAALWLASALSCGLAWLASSYQTHDCSVADDDLRVVLWNVSRNTRNIEGIAAIAGALSGYDPDIIGLVEAGPNGPAYRARWHREFPGYALVMPREDMAVLLRGTIERSTSGDLEGISQYADVAGTVAQRGVRIVLVDLDASPRFNRQRLIPEVLRLVGDATPDSTILMGDFNTPLDATAFRTIRTSFRHAFEEAGRGLPGTWTNRLPLFAIDHVWLSSGLVATCTELVAVSGYDHKQVRVRVSTRPVRTARVYGRPAGLAPRCLSARPRDACDPDRRVWVSRHE